MPKQIFKYKINHHLSLLPRSIEIRDVKNQLKESHSISASTFDRDRNILLDSDQSIPTDRLDVYSILFDISPDMLKNYTVEGQSIYETKSVAKTDNLTTGLVKP